jgi:hypothetical protein
LISNPHGEEPRSGVSNHEAPDGGNILRDAASRLLRNEGIELAKTYDD